MSTKQVRKFEFQPQDVVEVRTSENKHQNFVVTTSICQQVNDETKNFNIKVYNDKEWVDSKIIKVMRKGKVIYSGM